MKSLYFSITCAIIACMITLTFIPNGHSQSQENYFDAVEQWDNYYAQHPELTDSMSHEYKIYLRWRSFWDNRATSADSALSGNPDVIRQALNTYMQNFDYYDRVSTIGADWKQIGPYYTLRQKNGLVSAVWVDTVGDTTFNTIYIGTNSSGIWKTINGGVNWSNVTDRGGLSLLGISDIKGDPYNSNIIYAASGGEYMGRDFSYSIGILRTDDGGVTWNVIYGLEPNQITSVNCLLIDPFNTDILYAGVRERLIRLTKSGTTWDIDTIATMPKDSTWDNLEYRRIRDIEMKPGAPDTLYVATDHRFWAGHRKAQIWRITGANSYDTAKQQLDTLLPSTGALYTERFELAVTPQYPNWIYAQGTYFADNHNAYDSIFFAIWRSKDAGITWKREYQELIGGNYWSLSLMGCGSVNYHKNELMLNPRDTSVFYVGGNTMTRVVNWNNVHTTNNNIEPEYHVDTRAAMLVYSTSGDGGTDDILFAGNDGGISKTTNGINSWTNINGDSLILTQFYSVASVDADSTRVCGGVMDNGFFAFNGTSWLNSKGGDGGHTLMDAQESQYVYTNSFSPFSDIYETSRSSNNGISWLPYHPTISQECNFNKPIILNPANQNSLYAGGFDMFRTNAVRDFSNYTITRIPVHIGGDSALIKPNQTLISIAVSPADSNLIYLAYGGPHWDKDGCWHKLLKTSNGGISYSDLLSLAGNDTLLNTLFSLGITDICLSPTDTNLVWVTIGGFDNASNNPPFMKKRVFFSDDGGENFTDFSEGLPNFPVNCITYWEGANGYRLFAGTDIGVYYRDAEMDCWIPFTSGMPKAIVTEIVVLPGNNLVRASTFGRGIYESDLTCNYVTDTLKITSDTTWSQPFTSDQSILVQSPAILTVRTTVKFPPSGKIMVEPGATLIVDEGILTNACFNMWQGIEVWGNRNLPQIPASNQGLVSIRNGSIIKNARFGVSTGATDSLGNLYWNTVGGVIKVYNSTFQNNYKDIQFMPYSYPNTSRFQEAVFETTSGLADGQSHPSDHVSMCDVNGIMFQGCTFRNRTPLGMFTDIAQRGNGIHSIDATYTVTGWCANQEPPCSNPVQTAFSGLNYGILTYNTNPTDAIRIENSGFTDNRRGIYLSNADYTAVTTNTFEIPVWNNYDTCYGLYLGSCTGYHVEGNQFVAHNNGLFTGIGTPIIKEIGLIVDNSGGHPNEIYRNYFDTLDIAINAQRVNRNDGAYPDEGGGIGQQEVHTGLVLKCNIYHNNTYDVTVTRENPTGNEGIAYYQGNPEADTLTDLAGNLFSPYHDTVQVAESDILNDGSFIFYYHHIQGQFPTDPRVKPDFYTVSTVQPVQIGFNFDTIGCCPSRIESGGLPDEMKDAMIDETDSIDLLLTEYNSLVDGGSTEEINEDIFFSQPPDAIPLHQDLLSESPYLSDTVMKSAIAKEDVLPNAMIRDILVANPQSAKSAGVLDELNNRFDPMPEPMMAEILAGQSLISAKEVLDGAIASRKLQRQDLYYRLIRSYKTDTVNASAHDSLILLLQEEYSLKAKYYLAFEYLKSGDSANVINTLNAIPNVFDLSDAQEALFNDYQEYFDILLTLTSENKSILELTQDQIIEFQSLSANGGEPVSSYARNVLLANQLTGYFEPILLPDLTKLGPEDKGIKTSQINTDHLFRLYPNPAKHYAIIEYSLKENQNSQNQVIFVITNQEGKVMERIVVYKQQDQFVLNMSNYVPGVYISSLYSSGKVLQSHKFVVIR